MAKVLMIRDENGNFVGVPTIKGERGPAGSRGPEGPAGRTPVKGIDYFTAAEIADIEDEVADAITPSLNAKIQVEKEAREAADAAIDAALDTEVAARTAADSSLQSGLTTEAGARDAADAAINAKIPTQASPTNQLADKDFVNSSIVTNTAFFRGTFNSVEALRAYTGPKTNNDYAFVVTYDPVEPTEVLKYDRYKWNTEAWVFEFTMNNSSFTAAQWAAINSGISAAQVALISTALQPNDNISKLFNDAGYLTQHQSLAEYAKMAWVEAQGYLKEIYCYGSVEPASEEIIWCYVPEEQE